MKIVLTHIPKTGTTSIAHLFRDMLGDEEVRALVIPKHLFYIRDPKSLFWTDRKLFEGVFRKWMTEQYDIMSKATVIHGHHPAYLLKEFFPDHLYITWIRNPVSLQISWFYWNKQRKNWNAPKTMRGHLALGIYDDIQAKMMDADPLLFDFIGQMEFMQEDITWMWQVLGLEGTPPIMPVDNVQPFGYGHEIYSNIRMLSEIRMHNAMDMELYKSILERR